MQLFGLYFWEKMGYWDWEEERGQEGRDERGRDMVGGDGGLGWEGKGRIGGMGWCWCPCPLEVSVDGDGDGVGDAMRWRRIEWVQLIDGFERERLAFVLEWLAVERFLEPLDICNLVPCTLYEPSRMQPTCSRRSLSRK